MARSQYVQETLLPPEALEARVLVGIVGSADHAQAQVEVFDPTNGTLLSRWASPHVPLGKLDELLTHCALELRQAIQELSSPF